MRIYLFTFCLLSASVAGAQRITEKNIVWQSGQAVVLELKYARDIQINTWERDEVSVRASVSINNNTQNEAWSMTSNTSANQIRVATDLEPPQEDYPGDCPGGSYHLDKGRYCSLIVYEIYLPEGASLRVETLGGDITLRGIQTPVFAKSLSGWVDADWSAQQGATATMKSVTGEVYTNLDLELDEAAEAERRRRSPVGWEIEGTVAGGGVEVHLESVSNDVYFRRAGS